MIEDTSHLLCSFPSMFRIPQIDPLDMYHLCRLVSISSGNLWWLPLLRRPMLHLPIFRQHLPVYFFCKRRKNHQKSSPVISVVINCNL